MNFWLIVSLLFACVAALLPSCKQVNYTFYVLALTWPNEYCSQYSCDLNWKSVWDGKSFFIHGFWPSSTDLAYLSCFSQNGFDPFCYYEYKFSQYAFASSEIVDLKKYWPQIGVVKNFWRYEWQKHGTCYLDILKNNYNSKLSQAQLFKTYFMGTVNKVKNMKINLTTGQVNTKAELATKLGLKETQFYAICGGDNELDEIRICYNMSTTAGNETVMNCPKSTDRSQCKFPTTVK